MQRGTFQRMKSTNKSLILNKIRTSQPISRAQIAKETKLTPPTVSSIVKELMTEELVTESTLGESQGGRKPKMLLINQEAFWVIGVDAGSRFIRCIATDLAGEIVARAEPYQIQHPISEDQFTNALINIIQMVMDKLNNTDKVVGIGVAMHGVVNVEEGLSLVAPNLHLYNIPIKQRLEEAFDPFVKVENDVRAMALGESWLGEHGTGGSLLAVNLGSGVGAGLVIDGELYHGGADLAGEVGHMTIDLHGDVCTCGNRGCFQTFASEEAIAERAKRAVTQSVGEEARQTSQISTDNLTSENVLELAETGHEPFVSILQETGEVIGIALVNLIHVINPDEIILGGRVTKAGSLILPTVEQTIQTRALTDKAKNTPVSITEHGDEATLLGAVSLILVDIFEGTDVLEDTDQTV